MARDWWLNQHPITSAAEDLLDFADAARLLAERLRHCHRPADPLPGLRSLVVSFEAPPGSGKTSFSNLLLANLAPAADEKAPIPVCFSAALSRASGLSLWTALAYRIGEAFYRRLHRRALAAGADGDVRVGNPLLGAAAPVTLPAEDLAERRLHWLEVASRLSRRIPKEHWTPCLNLFSDAPSKIPGRRLDWQSATDTLIGLARAGLFAGTGQSKDAISEAAAAAKTLIDRPPVEGPNWGVDTEEFVRDLERLLRMLHPEATHWRAIVVLDDLFRLDEAEPELHEALAYLRRLDGVLTLINLDRGLDRSRPHLRTAGRRPLLAPQPAVGAERQVPPAAAPSLPPDGGTLDALIDVRMPIPAPGRDELFGFARRFVEELDLPLEESEISTFVRCLSDRGILGARETKKALLWLWLRLCDPQTGETLFQRRARPEGQPIPPHERIGMLELLVDLHRFVEGHATGARAFETAERHLSMLAHFPVCPWNLRPWIDRQVTTLDGWRNAQDLVLHLRLLTLAQFVEVDQRTSGHRARARELWQRWRAEVIGRDPLRLESMDGTSPQNLTTHLEVRLNRYPLAELFATALLASAARYFEGVAEAVAPSSLKETWFEADLLVQQLESPDGDPEARRRAWVVLSLLHPQIAQQIGDPPVSDGWRPNDPLLDRLETQRETLKALFDGAPQNR